MNIFKNYEIFEVFPTPIIKTKFKYHKKYKIGDYQKKENYPSTWRIPLNTSFPNIQQDDDFIQFETLLSLKKDLKKCIDELFEKMNVPLNYYFEDFWYNIYHKDHGQEPHDHLPSELNNNVSYWSGIYYAKNASPTTFLRTDFLSNALKFFNNKSNKLKNYCDNVFPEVKEGDLLLFPSHLIHAVPVKKDNHMRVTFAFNINFK